MSIAALFILDSKGRTVISRNYRGDIPMNAVNQFVTKITEEEEINLCPVILIQDITYMYVRHNGLYFMAFTDQNINSLLVVSFLTKLIEVLKTYFDVVTEETIRDNFVVIYELLDEMIDYGYPQITETKVLQNYITQESHRMNMKQVQSLLPVVTGAVSWRTPGIKYRKNEVFVDVIEKVNVLVSQNGSLLRSEILGTIKINCKLSGMPELRLGLNEKINIGDRMENNRNQVQKRAEMDDVSFHQCVRLSKFDSNRIIGFVPPDGEFELMNYRLTSNIRQLIWVESVIDRKKRNRIEILIKAKSFFREAINANNVQIRVPVPSDVFNPQFRSSIGTCSYEPQNDCALWFIKVFPGNREFMMRASFELPSIRDEETDKEKKPVRVNFEIPYYTVSGLQVRYLKVVEKTGYQSYPWVRYMTFAGDYCFRT
ncbi:AP-1 complex subunit mu-2, putative [Entamoeba dispar SAW760]|uniref:AP-1 complex subunit mu-2, putative n=2 Tax=Entamoeba TaxID=5758 RepID=B0EHB2_ENTDS|nr:AP-1 complex subunit mu-2, putative [Entamoeba dispar SAW760]XP_001741592.1 AP-1 complex subunit mu-2, putative [Entamoeba dispar SAW760]EDR21967.1 AP-1 complex subunit mu-2, putative [Entamoeba dispar SAW760]EDR26105.1 AP-1 complex subunit mu-2, putative [Entamoeba dispar SAW760]|eukprot:EDR21967.1 AP-1 complex subunit mu-2, putative [Entamoeba dispar SAW760]